jgi:hypothetical protein
MLFLREPVVKKMLLPFVFLLAFQGTSHGSDLDELKALQARSDAGPASPAVSSSSADQEAAAADWVAAGEKGYVNCLLTAFGQSTLPEIRVGGKSGIPSIVKAAEGNERVAAWAARLKFPYDRLSVTTVQAMLESVFSMESSTRGKLLTLLVADVGSSIAVIFYAEKEPDGGLKLTFLKAPNSK